MSSQVAITLVQYPLDIATLDIAAALPIAQACFLYTFEKTQGQNNSMFWPLAKNSRIFSPKTQSYEAQSKTWWYRILALKL